MFRIDHSQAAQLLREAHPLIDVMDRASHHQLRIQGAINIPLDEPGFVERVDEVVEDRHRPLVVHDHGRDCALAAQAAARLEAAGFTDVRLLVGGTFGWRSAGYMVCCETPPETGIDRAG